MAVKASAYEIAEGTQVHEAGVTYGPGESIPLNDQERIDYLLGAGWITPTKTTRKG